MLQRNLHRSWCDEHSTYKLTSTRDFGAELAGRPGNSYSTIPSAPNDRAGNLACELSMERAPYSWHQWSNLQRHSTMPKSFLAPVRRNEAGKEASAATRATGRMGWAACWNTAKEDLASHIGNTMIDTSCRKPPWVCEPCLWHNQSWPRCSKLHRSRGPVQLPHMTGACLERILRTEIAIHTRQ